MKMCRSRHRAFLRPGEISVCALGSLIIKILDTHTHAQFRVSSLTERELLRVLVSDKAFHSNVLLIACMIRCHHDCINYQLYIQGCKIPTSFRFQVVSTITHIFF